MLFSPLLFFLNILDLFLKFLVNIKILKNSSCSFLRWSYVLDPGHSNQVFRLYDW